MADRIVCSSAIGHKQQSSQKRWYSTLEVQNQVKNSTLETLNEIKAIAEVLSKETISGRRQQEKYRLKEVLGLKLKLQKKR